MTKWKKWRQYQLVQGDTMLMCWLESSAKLADGVRLTLKRVPGIWTVVHSYAIELDDPPLTKWQVGGLV